MSAFKKFNRQDVYVTAYSAKKSWEASGSVLSTYGIEQLTGISGSTPYYLTPSDFVDNRYEELTWRSIYHLYYRGYEDSISNSGSLVHYEQSSFLSGSRKINDEIEVFSIPRNVFGTHIEPGTFILQPQVSASDLYLQDDYAVNLDDGTNEYVENLTILYGSSTVPGVGEDYIVDEGDYVLETAAAGGEYLDTENSFRRELVDDGEGRLIYSSSVATVNVGDIIYTHGQVILTNPDVTTYYRRYLRPVLNWKSNQPIYTYNYNCKVKDSELTHTLNPSALTGSDGKIADNVSGSYFKPYVTSVGLYNDAQELVAVAKLGSPVPKSKETDMTFVVTLDM